VCAIVIDFRDINDDEHPGSEQLKSEETPVRFRDLDTLPDNPLDVDQNARDEERKRLYHEASRYLTGVFEAVKNRRAIPVETGLGIVARMVESEPDRDILFILAIHEDDHYDLMINHSINVAILSVKLGAGLGLKKEHLIRLGLTALLHDVGTALIPERILYKNEPLTQDEFKIMRKRPKYSYRLLQDLGDQFHYLADLAIQVYERIDGSGYPQGLKAEDIHEYAQIIGLADVYEALIHTRPQREKYLHFSAVKEIIKTVKTCYQRKHLKALLSNISIFPIFSYVRLNSEAIGKVIETYPDQPMRPRLRIVFDSQGRRVLTERIVNLPENPLLYIVDSVPEEDLEGMTQPV
jgi:HD-GYP domain-containing protein (c-di-GMP phosphodiesterase class II)